MVIFFFSEKYNKKYQDYCSDKRRNDPYFKPVMLFGSFVIVYNKS